MRSAQFQHDILNRPRHFVVGNAPFREHHRDIKRGVLRIANLTAGLCRYLNQAGQLADIELLTIQIRLVICSVDRAQEMGMTWWKDASFLSPTTPPPPLPDSLDERLRRLEDMQEALLAKFET